MLRLWEYQGDLGQYHHAHLLVIAYDETQAARVLFEDDDEDSVYYYHRSERIVHHLLGYDVDYFDDDGDVKFDLLEAAFVPAVAALPWVNKGIIEAEAPEVLLYRDGTCC